ncbi:MAG: hypothetical protein KA383_14930 [Phycisphaerae bacterium]|nr:hypothetical protein [Phycisphaerae bacterium]
MRVTRGTRMVLSVSLALLAGPRAGHAADDDVANVRFRGDGTVLGMRIGAVQTSAEPVRVETTGARFEYAGGVLRVFQGLSEPRRCVATLTLGGAPVLEAREQTEDHVLLWSAAANVGVYGDSTLIFAPHAELRLTCQGAFKPEYEGRQDGELLLIDERGGLAIYPQRHEAGYTVNKIVLQRSDWVADYTLRPGQRVMLAAFPGRPFDWERSFRTESVIVYGSMGKGAGNPYGEMPSAREIGALARHFNIMLVWHWGLYEGGRPEPPHVIVNEAEFRRLVQTAQSQGMKVAPYTSLFAHVRKFGEVEGYYDFVRMLVERYGVAGIYIDGMCFDYHLSKLDDKIANWEMIRRLRQLLGRDRVIVFHGTHLGTPTATMPNVDTYCDATIFGEGVTFKSVEDPYVRYQVRKYDISNTVAYWLYGRNGKPPEGITWEQCVDALVAMNGRGLSYSSVAVHEPPRNNKYVWGDGNTGRYRYYLGKLAPVRAAYLARLPGGERRSDPEAGRRE